jgi:hypothetical protein
MLHRPSFQIMHFPSVSEARPDSAGVIRGRIPISARIQKNYFGLADEPPGITPRTAKGFEKPASPY